MTKARQLREGGTFIWVYGSTGSIHNGRKTRQQVAGEGSWKLTSSTMNNIGTKWKRGEAMNFQSLLAPKYFLRQGFTSWMPHNVLPNSTTNREPCA